MKPGSFVAASGFILLAGAAAWAQSAGQAATIGALHVKEISVSAVDETQIKLAVNLAMVPAQTVTLANLRLCSLRLNGQPVFAEPLNQEIPLRKGAPAALPALYVTVLYRDLYTAEPLSRMIETQRVHLDGELVADLRLNFMEKLALGTQHPKVVIALDQDVPAATGTSDLERTVALGLLSVVDIGLRNKAAAARLISGSRPAWIGELEAQAKTSLYVVESSYTLAQGAQSNAVYLLELGFRLAPNVVVTTAEAHAPWKYDAEFQGAVSSGAARMAKNSYEVALYPVAPGSDPLKLSSKQFSLDVHGIPLQDQVTEAGIAPGQMQVTVLRRVSPGSMAVLKLRDAAATPGLAAVPAAVAGQDRWDEVVVFRQRSEPVSGKPFVEALQLAARREGNGIRLSEPVDAAAYGSPIVTRDGVLGMVQDELTGTFLASEMYTPGPQVAQ
jgi:hypothetical protein